VWWLLNERPNPRCSAAVFWEYLLSSMLLHGDAFARIVRKGRFRPDIEAFELLHPECVEVKTRDRRLVYTIYRTDGTAQVIDQDDMIHVPNLGFNGERGLSTLRSALLQPAGIALAAGNYSEEFFANGARPDFVISAKNTVTPEQANIIRESWHQRHSGTGRRHLPAVLQGEMEVKPLTMNSDDAQLLETRKYQTEDITRVFGVPGFMVGLTEKTTSWGTGIEQMSLGFVKFTLMRHLVKFQQEINAKCFRTSKYFGEFNTAALERGDIKSRYEAHRIALGRAGEDAFLAINEIRRIENLPPKKDGDELRKGSKDAKPDSKAAD
jgi:HK97 family phage portal protein